MSLAFSGGQLQSLTGIFAPTWDVNLVESVMHYLSGTSIYRQIEAGVPISGGPLYYHYPKISLQVAYPYNLTQQNLPHIALEEGPASDEVGMGYGAPLRDRAKMFTVHGFAGSYQHPSKNHWERSQLLGDIRQLLADARIPIYDFSSGVSVTRIGTGQTRILNAEMVSPNTPSAAEKFRFQVTFQVAY